MVHHAGLQAILVVLLVTATTRAGIPEPDMVLYGTTRLNGTLVTAQNPVTVWAKVRVGTSDRIVGRYRMGDNTPAGDRFVLRIRMESLADGSTQSPNAAVAGQAVTISVQPDTQPEVEMTTLTSQRGVILRQDLPEMLAGDVNADGHVDVTDLLYFVDAFGSVTGDANYNPDADFYADGSVDVIDLLMLVENFGLY